MVPHSSSLSDDCGKLFKSSTQAQAHAQKTTHANFSESTTAIKPLTEEEKAEKMKELKERMRLRKEEKRIEAIEEEKQRETVRR
jgi:hypothetical protein